MEPGVIRKLDEVVVNRIAAGEIIQRPANALKELLENSLDAKSTHIQVTVKSGGLKLMQIQDNGTGIRRDDLGIVCERFTTSKLNKFEDLSSIATFGFRGEALASISHVAHLSIQTKTAQERCGYKASYSDGKLKAPAKPCAGNQGTIITIEDLFYNMPQRRQCLKSPAEEYQKIYDVVSKYAVHNAKVGFSLKKYGEQPSVKTQVGSTRTQNIQQVYGAQIAKDLLEFQLEDELHRFKLKALITKVNYAHKKGTMLLFINERLVESAAIKAAIDAVYSAYLPKGMHPFVYLSLQLPAHNVDVNVHPTKHEVHFLHEDDIIEKIKAGAESHLLGSNETRVFYKQLKLPGAADIADEDTKSNANKNNDDNTRRSDPKHMIRTDAKEQKLDKFLHAPGKNVIMNADQSQTTKNEVSYADDSFRALAARSAKEVRLTSVLNMRKRWEQGCNVLLRKTMKELVFVGVVDKHFALIQHETKLYLCNTLKYSEELFYQRLLYEFQNFPLINIVSKLKIEKLIRLALDTEDGGWTAEDGDKDELAATAANILLEKAAIMREYFGLRINTDEELESLPCLLPKHMPCVTFLPLYMLRLATEVEWETEEACFETFCRETARFYALVSGVEAETQAKQHHWQVEHVIYPAFKQFLLPPDKLKKHLYELTSLPKLYKVFERC